MELYQETSQFKFWRFSQDELQFLRKRNLERQNENISKGKQLSIDDYMKIQLFYLGKMSDVCEHFSFPFRVFATAAVYFSRFYLLNSMRDHSPRLVMLTCVFLSSKVENNNISLDKFCNEMPKVSQKDIIDTEYVLTNGIRFHLDINHCYQALHGVYLDMGRNFKSDAYQLFQCAIKYAKNSYFADTLFIYQPSQIALACFKCSSEELKMYSFQLYLSDKCFEQDTCDIIDEISEQIKSINIPESAPIEKIQ